MNELRLKAGKSFAPAGAEFIDPKTGFKACGYERGIQGAIDMLVQHRLANPKTFTNPQQVSPAMVRQEFLRDLQTKAPHLFQGSPVPTVTRTATGFPEKCPCGSTEFEPYYCPTCSGQRITGHKCKACGKLFGI